MVKRSTCDVRLLFVLFVVLAWGRPHANVPRTLRMAVVLHRMNHSPE